MENREREIEELMHILIKNQRLANQSGVPDECYTIVCASQMLGSGKTHFGRAFLSQASTAKFRERWTLKYPSTEDQEIVDRILDAIYIYIDLRDVTNGTFSERIRSTTVQILNIASNLVVNERPELKSEIEQYWSPILKTGKFTIVDVINYFKVLLQGKLLFIHLDEIDRIVFDSYIISRPEGTPANYYNLWRDLLQPVVKHGLCYVSGLAPILFFVGKDHSHNWSATSHHMFFDRLLPTNIQNLIKQCYLTRLNYNGSALTNDLVEAVAKRINYWSAGVPRLVVVALEYFTSNGGNIHSLIHDEEAAFRSHYKNILSEGHIFAELSQYLLLETDEERQQYMQYMGDALLGIPHRLGKHNHESFAVLSQLWKLGIYRAKSPQTEMDSSVLNKSEEGDDCFYPIFPYAVAIHLRENKVWPTLYADSKDTIVFTSTRTWLEALLVQTMVSRIKNNLAAHRSGHNHHVGEALPFLLNSAIASHSLKKENMIIWTFNINSYKSYLGNMYYYWPQHNTIDDVLVFLCKSKFNLEQLKKEIATSLRSKWLSKNYTLGKVVFVVVGATTENQSLENIADLDSDQNVWKISLAKIARKGSILKRENLEVYVLTQKGVYKLLTDSW